jgi:3-hexulose-6-phosphate synthase
VTDLQLALDVLTTYRALELVEATYPFFNRIEAGTPLIKSVGTNVCKILRETCGALKNAVNFPRFKIVADMKTLDGGEIETKMAIDAGASCVMVSGHASDATISHAIKTAHSYGAELMVELDTMLPDILKRARQVTGMGADSYEYHIGIDFRQNGADPTSRRNIRLLKKLNNLNSLAVAGGMNPDKIYRLIQIIIPSTIVVGTAVVKAKEPGVVAISCGKALRGIKP